MESAKNNSKKWIPVILVGVPVIIRIAIYVYMAIKGIGTFAAGNYISIVMNLIMYVSILKYAVDYFIKGKDVSLNGLIFKFGIAALSSLLGLQTASKTVFMLTAVMVFIVPYISASLIPAGNDKKKGITMIVLIVAVLAISVVLSVLSIQNPTENAVSKLGTSLYNLDCMNSAIEWALFTLLVVARGLFTKKKQ